MLSVLKLRVSRDSVDAFREALTADFGGLTSRTMNSSSLAVGPYGIDGFIDSIIDEILDILPLEHINYGDLKQLLVTFCGELAHKMSNYRKVRVLC